MKNKILTDKYTELYLSWNNKFIEIKEKFKDRNLSGPFLISPSNLYEKQKKKLMIIGQETKCRIYTGGRLDYKRVVYTKASLIATENNKNIPS